jgi:hypothetical protein
MTGELGANEIFCRSCGDPIKENAEICPECGVRNAAYSNTATRQSSRTATSGQTTSGGQTSSSSSSSTDTSYDSEPSGSWVLGVKASTVIWGIIVLLTLPTVFLAVQSMGAMGAARFGRGMGSILGSAVFAVFIPLLQLVAWFLFPISLYLDLQYVDYHVDDWPLNGTLYIAGAALLPILTQILTVVSFFLGPLGVFISLIIPSLLTYMGYNHLSTRSRLLDGSTA